MSFPKEVNPQAVRQVIRYVTGQDTDKGRLALAGYELEGNALNLMFPNAAYIQDGMTTAAPCEECPCPDDSPLHAALKAELAAAPKQGPIDWTKLLEQMKTVIGPILLQILTNILMKDA